VNGDDMSERIAEFIGAEVDAVVDNASDERGEIDYEKVFKDYKALVMRPKVTLADIDGLDREALLEMLYEDSDRVYDEVEERFGAEIMRAVERHVMLSIIDKLWVQHLTEMDDLRDGVGLQAYGQRDPLVVYKSEGFRMFGLLLGHIQHDVVHTIFRVQPAVAQQPVQNKRKIGANDPCWCGSGKKFKKCHGAPAARKAAV
jgi:preprotein translocase subunit SecA